MNIDYNSNISLRKRRVAIVEMNSMSISKVDVGAHEPRQ